MQENYKQPLDGEARLLDYSLDVPAEAARLMGYEVVENEQFRDTKKLKEEPMEKMDKPRICEILSGKDNPLRVGEVFTIRGYPNWEYRYAVVHTDGKLHNYLEEPCQTTGTRVGNKIGVNTLYWIFNHPDSIIRKPHFTEDEKICMRVLYAAGGRELKRKDGMLGLICEDGKIGLLPDGMFPGLLQGQAVKIGEVIKI